MMKEEGQLTIELWLLRLSRKVGTRSTPSTVPRVKSTGPRPRIPSTPSNPLDDEATPICWSDTVKPANEIY